MAIPPLPDTERLVDWDELPDRARSIRADFDPSAGVWMQHQTDWVRFRADLDIAVAEKGRRTGITFAEAQDDTIIAASTKGAGGDNIWYMGDTREKGLEFIGYCAKIAQVVARGQHTRIEQHIFHDQTDDGGSREIQAYRIRFASGYRNTSQSSRPENIHGLQGIVVIDEAALHHNVRGVLESATALLIWGGRIRVISTHRGKRNPFNELIADIRAGRYGKRADVYRVTFDDAVANGLYERVCWMQRKAPTADGKRDWYAAIRSAYGPRTAAMREELDAIPRDGSGSAIPTIWIERAMPVLTPSRPVIRLALEDAFARRSEDDREMWCRQWIASELLPIMAEALLDRGRHVERWAVGMDFARHRHFSVVLPAYVAMDLRRECPFAVELHNVPTRQQEQILWALLDELPSGRWSFAGDASGPGQTLMEYTGDRYGRAELDRETGRYLGGPVHEIVLSRPWYGAHMPPYIRLFEDGQLTLPRDASFEDDHRALEWVDGVPMVPRLELADRTDAELVRHGDSAIAGALMEFAAAHATHGQIEFQTLPDARHATGWRTRPDTADDWSDARTGAW